MIRHTMLRRALAGAFGTVLALGVLAPAAHASEEFPSDPSATAVEQCEQANDGWWIPYVTGEWHVHLENSAFGKDTAHFTVTVDNGVPQTVDLQPDNSQDLVIRGLDGLPSHIVVIADNTKLVDTTTTAHCNDPYTYLQFECAGPWPQASIDTINYGIGNDSDVPMDFVLHRADGTETTQTLTTNKGVTLGYWDKVVEGQHYDVWISIDGVQVKHLTGTVDCEPDPTPPTVQDAPPPATTPPVQDPPPATTPPVQDPPADPPAEVQAAEVTAPVVTAPELARTGADTVPLAATGLALIGAGSLVLAAERRRLAARQPR